MQSPRISPSRRLWAWLVLALSLVAAPSLQAQCWSCVLGPRDPQGACYNINFDGYYECVQTSSYCSGVLPRCFSGLGSLTPDGSVRVAGEEMEMEIEEPEPVAVFASFEEGEPAVHQRRGCDGAVVRRTYTAQAATELRDRSRLLKI